MWMPSLPLLQTSMSRAWFRQKVTTPDSLIPDSLIPLVNPCHHINNQQFSGDCLHEANLHFTDMQNQQPFSLVFYRQSIVSSCISCTFLWTICDTAILPLTVFSCSTVTEELNSSGRICSINVVRPGIMWRLQHLL